MPRGRPAWRAFCYLSTWRDGSGGWDHSVLEKWIELEDEVLSEQQVADVRKFVPVLIAEDGLVTQEDFEARSKR